MKLGFSGYGRDMLLNGCVRVQQAIQIVTDQGQLLLQIDPRSGHERQQHRQMQHGPDSHLFLQPPSVFPITGGALRHSRAPIDALEFNVDYVTFPHPPHDGIDSGSERTLSRERFGKVDGRCCRGRNGYWHNAGG